MNPETVETDQEEYIVQPAHRPPELVMFILTG